MFEEPFFYKTQKDYELFGIMHYPNGKDKSNHNCGIIFCSPFAEEKLWSHRVFVNFARLLAGEGYAVLRFDYMGHGDSDGSFEDSTIETRLSDIESSVEIIKQKADINKVGLLGLRLGASLAVVTAEKNRDIDFLILWEPVVKVETYLQQCLRSNLAMQMAIYKKIVENRKKITGKLIDGKSANIDGYMMSRAFYEQASKIDLINYDINFSNPVKILQISRNKKKLFKKDLEELFQKKYKEANQFNELSIAVEEPFWSEIKTYYQNAHDLFDKTQSWLSNVIV